MKTFYSTTSTFLQTRNLIAMVVLISLLIIGFFHSPVSARNYSPSFDGGYDRVSVSPIPTFNNTITIEALVKIALPSSYEIAEPNIVLWGGLSNSVEFSIRLNGANAYLQFGMNTTGDSVGTWKWIAGSTNLKTGNWVHVAVVKNGTSSTLYVNGVTEVTETIDRLPYQNAFTIGNLNESGAEQPRYFPGLIDEVRIWNTARSQSEIQANMNKKLAGTETGLTSYHKMTKGKDSLLADNQGKSTEKVRGITWSMPMGVVHLFVSDDYATSYATVKDAFDAINAGWHTGAIKLKLAGISIVELETAVLYQSGYSGSGGTSSYSSVDIYPTTPGLTISGDLDAPLIDLNGADNVTIDGRVNATGTDIDMVITNTSTSTAAGTSTIRLINDASTNTVKYCTIKGSSNDAAAGIIFFSTTEGSTGNDGNLIDNNDITNSADDNRPVNAIYSLGTSAKENSGNTISNNNIYDFLNRGINSYGIKISDYATSYAISGNSFYETNSFVPTTGAASHYLISIYNTTGTDFTISDNYMGGSSPDCGTGGGVGSWTKTDAQNNSFYGIYLNVGAGTVTSIQGNTMKNFSYSSSGFSAWAGIFSLGGGDLNIGTLSGNTIGESTGNGSITFTGGSAGSNFYGIYIQNTGTVKIQNNAIGSIQTSNASSANSTNFIGIYKSQSGLTTISNNTIGSTTTANSIHASSASTDYAQSVYGIKSAGTGTVTISGNTLSKLTNGTTNPSSATTGLVQGIVTIDGTNAITNNTVRDLTIANANTMSDVNASVIGIVQISTTDAAQSVTGNIIYNLSNTYTLYSECVMGLYYAGPGTQSTVSGNFIHSLAGSSTSSYIISGMTINGGTTTFSNNIISLGGNTSIGLRGIEDRSGTNNYYFNTVYIGGVPTSSSTEMSMAMHCGNTNTKNIRNNLFINARSNSESANGKHYCMYIESLDGLTIDYNDYYASGTGGYLGRLASTEKTSLSDWKTLTSQDANSVSTNPAFTLSPPETAAANYVVSASLPGVSGTGITTDYFGTIRGATPRMGAYENSCNAPAISSQSTAAQTRCINSAFPDITVTAGGDGLSYQWYSKATAENSEGNTLGSNNGAQTNSYTPQSGTAGTLYYYCEVTGSCGSPAISAASGAFVVNPASSGGTVKW